MKEYRKAVLDLNGCRSYLEFHLRIKEAFGFPDYYGCNWDAFVDSFVTEGVPDKVVVKGEQSVSKELASSVERMYEELEYVRQNIKSFDDEMEIIREA